MLSINSANFENLLLRFLSKGAVVTGETLVLAEQFLFKSGDLPARNIDPQLLDTLKYLKRLMKRNNLKTLQDLELYYGGQRKKASEVFDQLKETDPEECFALHFQEAYTMHMKTLHVIEHNFKSNNLYYLSHCDYVQFSVVNSQEAILPYTPFYASEQLEKHFIATVKGNKLALDEKKSSIPSTRIKELVSN